MVFPLNSLPAKSDVFIDANIFINGVERKSQQCWNLLDRCASEDVFGITSLNTLIEVTHKLMGLEAISKRMIRDKQTVKQLNENPEIVKQLTDYWVKINQIRSMNILILDVDESAFDIAQAHRIGHGFLTNDSLITAVMERFSLSMLATHDAAFEDFSNINCYRPDDI